MRCATIGACQSAATSEIDNVCAKLTTCDGSELSWVDEIRYLGVLLPDLENSNA